MAVSGVVASQLVSLGALLAPGGHLAELAALVVTDEPWSSRAYAVVASRRAAAAQEGRGENGWAHLERALTIRDDVLGDLGGEPVDVSVLVDPGSFEEIEGPVARAAMERRALAYLEALAARGAFDALDDLAAAERWIAPVPVGPLAEVGLRSGGARALARVCRARMRLALAQGLDAEAGRAFAQMMAIARAVGHQPGLPSRLVGAAVCDLALGALDDTRLRYGDVGAEAWASIGAALERPVVPALHVHIEAMRLAWLETTGRVHGRLGWVRPRAVVEAFYPEREWPRPAPAGVSALGAVLLSSRGECARLVNAYFDRWMALQAMEPGRRFEALGVFDELCASVSPRQVVAGWLADPFREGVGVGFPVVVERLEAMRRFRVEAARLIGALELHRARTGRYPAALAELVPVELPEVAWDPITGRRFGYARLGRRDARNDRRARGVDEEGAGYILYSVGYDLHDDGGTVHPEGNAYGWHEMQALLGATAGYVGALGEPEVGVDYIISMERDRD